MKMLGLFALALGGLFLAGCASGDAQHYTPTQIAEQHAGYDPTPHTYGNRY